MEKIEAARKQQLKSPNNPNKKGGKKERLMWLATVLSQNKIHAEIYFSHSAFFVCL
ncbi:MAG: hypothetical protein IPM95_14480 [Sphingobacteriales bacterium]|nr:hypothetical protein [Sphingobacteriales bacterium]